MFWAVGSSVEGSGARRDGKRRRVGTGRCAEIGLGAIRYVGAGLGGSDKSGVTRNGTAKRGVTRWGQVCRSGARLEGVIMVSRRVARCAGTVMVSRRMRDDGLRDVLVSRYGE